MLPNVRIKKILYATDLSENATHAFAYAISLAERYKAGITILHVMAEFPEEHFITNMINSNTWKEIKSRHYSEVRESLTGKKRNRGAIKEVLQAFSDEVVADTEAQADVTDEILIERGTPAEKIVATANEQNCDLIVMGTHGHGVISDVLVGSTAKWVVKNASVPVLVIRLPE